MKKGFVMNLDESMLGKVAGYYLYRSLETSSNRPVIDGLYIQRDELDGSPPKKLKMEIEVIEA